MPATATDEYDCSIFNTDKALYDALISNDKTLVNSAIHCLKEKFLHAYGNSGNYKNKWYADDCLLIAINQFLKYLNDGKFILGEKPIIVGLYIFFKRRIIDFDKQEIKKNKHHKQVSVSNEDFYEKMQKQNERKRVIDAAISLLRDNCQKILKMRYFDELSIFQIAEARQMKTESLYVETTRCKKELKTILINKFNFPPHGLWV